MNFFSFIYSEERAHLSAQALSHSSLRSNKAGVANKRICPLLTAEFAA